MLYACFRCGQFSFELSCRKCSGKDDNVSLDPAFYPEFHYQSQGFVMDLLGKGKAQEQLSSHRNEVLRKYQQFEKPYFVNYVHWSGRAHGATDPAQDPELHLFNAVLLRLGFSELSQFPQLLAKLVRTTSFRFQYEEFRQRFLPHIKATLEETVRSYVNETGPTFRTTACMMLYTCWVQRAFPDRYPFALPNPQRPEVPLLSDDDVANFLQLCEQVHWVWQVDRLQVRLERFDQSRVVSIYDVDAMNGFAFEDFLAKMFRTLGYDVEETKRTGDQGADLFVVRFGQKTVIQAKNYADNVGNAAVQQVVAAKNFYNADQAMVVCNRYFTPSAKELAGATGVTLVDRDEFQRYLDEYNRQLLEQAG
jgi:restriction system protein